MKSGENSNGSKPQQAAPGIGLEDVCFTLFRHKWLILGFFCLGIMGAATVRFIKPPRYQSTAKVLIHYVEALPRTDGEHSIGTESGSQSIISTEVEILRSLDVATNAAAIVTPERILAKMGGGHDLMAAASALSSGIDVENPLRTAILTISYKNRDRELVQPVLRAIIEAYKRKHNQVHSGGVELDEAFARQRDDLGKKLAETEEELKKIQTDNKIVTLEDKKRHLETEIAKWQGELFTAQIDLAERKAGLSVGSGVEPQAGGTNAPEAVVPEEKVSEYAELVTELGTLKQRERELRRLYQDSYPSLQSVVRDIQTNTLAKIALERQFPSLARMTVSTTRSGTNSPAADLAQAKSLGAKIVAISNIVALLQADAARVLNVEPRIMQLQRLRDSEATNYVALTVALRQALLAESTPGNNMSVFEQPTPPYIDKKKLMKLLGGVFGACAACGLGLAFLIDFVLDRTLKRSTDIERHLRMPVFLSIPDSSWTSRKWLPGFRRNGSGRTRANGDSEPEMAVEQWNPRHHLQSYTEGLRERVITYFENKNMGLKKPKLVGVTGCGHGSGVSTLASGLAAALSTTGDGNVLLVDMNAGNGVAHSFYKGKPGCGISDVLGADTRAEAQVQSNLYLAAVPQAQPDKLTKSAPIGFNHLVPQLKASDYDYIIFDFPPVTQTSPTPRLASHMDITLLVVESEKTGQQLASRAAALMRESRVTMAAVLNKYRPHLPARLSQEL
jgi:uncharacterized protein involved in exopolysaccharide biosynthesis/Mrp family chromosome partitioning ATPase